MKWTLLVSFLFLAACSSSSDHTGSPTNYCHCSPKAVASGAEQINQMRTDLVNKWKAFHLAQGQTELVTSLQDGNVSVNSPNDKKCSFHYQGIRYQTRQEIKKDQDGKDILVFIPSRTMDSYTLNSETTEDPKVCATLANGDDPWAAVGSAMLAAISLYLEKADQGGEHKLMNISPKIQKLFSGNEGKVEYVPLEMVAGDVNGLETYSIEYSMKQPNGFVGKIYFSYLSAASPMGYTWDIRLTGTYKNQDIDMREQMLNSINGVALP